MPDGDSTIYQHTHCILAIRADVHILGPDAATLQDYSNRQAAIFNASSALFPSIYLPDGLLQRPENVTAYIRAMVAESLRVGGGIRNDKPIFPYAWHYYHSGTFFRRILPFKSWRRYFRVVVMASYFGVVP